MNNLLYPNSIFDNNLKNCSSGACSPKKQKEQMPHSFEARNFYPHSITPQPNGSNTYQNQPPQHQAQQYQHNHQRQAQPQHNHPPYQANGYAPQNYSHEPRQPYDYNAYVQANSYGNQNWQDTWQSQNQPPHQYHQNTTPPEHRQEPRQRNMFGSLDPQQLMSMITNKNSFAGLLSGLGNSNPQLSMLMGLMQNAPKAKRQQQEKKPEEIIIDDENEKKTSPYKTVKDFYKENP